MIYLFLLRRLGFGVRIGGIKRKPTRSISHLWRRVSSECSRSSSG